MISCIYISFSFLTHWIDILVMPSGLVNWDRCRFSIYILWAARRAARWSHLWRLPESPSLSNMPQHMDFLGFIIQQQFCVLQLIVTTISWNSHYDHWSLIWSLTPCSLCNNYQKHSLILLFSSLLQKKGTRWLKLMWLSICFWLSYLFPQKQPVNKHWRQVHLHFYQFFFFFLSQFITIYLSAILWPAIYCLVSSLIFTSNKSIMVCWGTGLF